MESSSSFRERELFPSRQRAVVTVSLCSWSLSNMKKTEFRLVSTDWISLCPATFSCFWICFSLSVAYALWWKKETAAAFCQELSNSRGRFYPIKGFIPPSLVNCRNHISTVVCDSCYHLLSYCPFICYSFQL